MDKSLRYIYKIEKSGKLLVFFGADHSFDISHKQWKDIRSYFNMFLEKTGGKNCVVLVEGGGTDLKESEEVSIREGGEPLFTTFIAHQAGLNTLSPEPDESYEINQLLKTFSQEEIMHYYFTRLADQWNRYDVSERPDFESYMEKFLDRYKKTTGWEDFAFTVEHMKEVHQQISGKKFEETGDEKIHQMIWPTHYNWISNKVSAASSKIRNNYIESEIKRYWDEGKNMFIVYGQGHAVENEPFLRKNLD